MALYRRLVGVLLVWDFSQMLLPLCAFIPALIGWRRCMHAPLGGEMSVCSGILFYETLLPLLLGLKALSPLHFHDRYVLLLSRYVTLFEFPFAALRTL